MRHFPSLLFLLAFHAGVAAASERPAAMTAEAGMALLREGNARYVAGVGERRYAQASLRERLARDGQSPVAAVLACADSRVPVEAIFDQPVGGLFVVRTAGNSAGVQALGSMQYAVEHLGVPLAVVLAHTGCGAVAAALAGADERGPLGEMVDGIGKLRPAVENADDPASALAILNARETARALADVVGDGAVKIAVALYDIETGETVFE